MLVALDVAYGEADALAAAVAFADWPAAEAAATYTALVAPVAAYEPGFFYRRELPCLLAVLTQLDLATVAALVVDGYVALPPDGRPGLGQHLYEALDGRVPVVGVAKTRFAGSGPQVAAVRRGQSQNPLYVSSAGLPLAEAARHVAAMHGPHRLPTLLKRVDELTRPKPAPPLR